MIFCIDIGNTHTHFGRVAADIGLAAIPQTIATGRLDHPIEGLAPHIRADLDEHGPVEAIAFCSVVPAANLHLRRTLEPFGAPVWQLTADARLGVAISYPRPEEIGHDRLANAAGAQALAGSPAVVIDLGTAVTFDVVTRRGGYEGGIIAPGPALMTRYLHERTAQLPLVEDLETPVTRPIGHSTAEAMRIGAVLGFAGLIQACLDAVIADLRAHGEPEPAVIATGGAAAALGNRLRQPLRDVPDLTLRGLAVAWRLSRDAS